MSQSILKAAAGVAALAAIAFGASAIAGASHNGSAGGTRVAPAMPGPGSAGVPPPGARGGGTPVTGATAAKVSAAALARYPGTVEGVHAMPGGGYIALILRSGGGEVPVLVNSQFKVIGTVGGPGGPGGRGGPGGARPFPGGAATPRTAQPGTGSSS